MGSLSEGVRVAAAQDRTVADGEQRAVTLVRQAVGGRVAGALTIVGASAGDRVVLNATGQLPPSCPASPISPSA